MTPISFKPRHRGPNVQTLAKWLGVLLLVACVLVWRSTIAGLLWKGFEPVLAARSALGSILERVGAQFVSKDILQVQNRELTEALASSNAALVDRDTLYQENLDLKSRLGHRVVQKRVLAGVVASPPALPYDELIIDAGSRDGVAVGQPVSASGTWLIGTVSEVFTMNARVRLFSSSGETHDALLQLQHGSVPVTIEGQGAGSLVGKVPMDTGVSVGDSVVFPGITSGFIASVSAIDAPANQSFMTIYMHVPVSPFSLRYVEVWGERN